MKSSIAILRLLVKYCKIRSLWILCLNNLCFVWKLFRWDIYKKHFSCLFSALVIKMWDSPYLTCLFLYIFSLQIIVTNSRTSNVWKLNADEDQIVDGSTLSQVSQKSIIMSVNIYIINALDFLLHTYILYLSFCNSGPYYYLVYLELLKRNRCSYTIKLDMRFIQVRQINIQSFCKCFELF